MGRALREAAKMVGDNLPGHECLTVMIRRWEDSRGGVSERYRLHYCKAFQLPIDQFGVASTTTSDAPKGESPESPASAAAPSPCKAAETQHPVQPASGGEESTARLGQPVEAQLLAAARESGRYARKAERRDLSGVSMEHFRTAVLRLCRELLTAEPISLFSKLRTARDDLHRAMSLRSWPGDQRELHVMLACVNGFMATAAHHAGSAAAAEGLAYAGLTYATAISDRSLIGQLRANLATIAYWSGSLHDCLDQADAGLEQNPDGLVTAQLHLLRARAAARLGDFNAALRAVADADQARDAYQATDPKLGLTVSQITFSSASHHYYTGAVHAYVPDSEKDAAAELERAIELYTEGRGSGDYRHHEEMAARIDLATVRLRLGDLDAAQVAVGPVFALPTALRVACLSLSFEQMQSGLAKSQYRGSQAAKDFDAQIERFCAR